MDWRKVTIGSGTDIDDFSLLIYEIRVIFKNIYKETGRAPKDFYVFLEEYPDRVLHFSPVAATFCESLLNQISRDHKVLPCDAPEVYGRFMVGDSNNMEDFADFIIRSKA